MPIRRTRLAQAFFLLVFTLSQTAFPPPLRADEKIESYPVEKLPWKEPPVLQKLYCRIEPEAAVSPAFDLIFTIPADDAIYQARGLKNLPVRLKEIDLIFKLKEMGSGDQTAEGVAQSIEDTGKGFVLIVAHPVETGKNLGRATGKLFRGGARFFKGKKQKSLKKQSLKDRLFDGAKRDVANEVGADVYSDNPGLQNELGRIAAGRVGGKTAVTIGKFFIPITLIGNIAMTASNVSQAADQMVNTKDPGELYELNRKAFIEIGLDEKAAEGFLLDNTYYNPREQTRIRYYFAALKEVGGWKKVLGEFKDAKAERAEKIYTSLQMMVAEFERQKDWKQMGSGDRWLYASGADGAAHVFLPFDFFFLNAEAKKVIGSLKELKDRLRARSLTVYNLGMATPAVRNELAAAGLTLHDGVFFETDGKAAA